MHLTALVDHPDHVCCRYRLAAFRSILENNGHTLELLTLPQRWWSRLWLLRTLRGASVILQRRLLPPWETALLRRTVKHLLFDLDDAVFLRDSYSRRGLHHPGRLNRFAAIARASDAVIAGNAFLAEQARRWTGSDCVHVIPTCVDPTLYSPRTHTTPARRASEGKAGSLACASGLDGPLVQARRASEGKAGSLACASGLDGPLVQARRASEGKADSLACASGRCESDGPVVQSKSTSPLQLVWVGSSSTLRGLEAVTPLLEEIGRSVPGVQLKLICDRFLRLGNMPVIECPWSEPGEAEAIAAGDVGISWIPDDLWSRGKCGLKVLQYMAAGLPVVANPVGVHPEMIRQGQNGYLASTPREWVDAVTRLAWDVSLRQRMGQLGRYRVEADYSIEAGAARWITVLDRLQNRCVALSRAASG